MERRLGRRLPVLVVLVLVMQAWTGPAAEAHSDLVSSEPAYGVTVAEAPDPILLHFDEPVELRAAATELFLAGRRVRRPKPSHATGNKRTVSVVPTVSDPGRYLFRWFFFGYDGHLMAGELAYTIDPAAAVPGSGAGVAPAATTALATPVPAVPQRGSDRFAPTQGQGEPVAGTAAFVPATENFDAAGDLPPGFLAPGAAASDEPAADLTAAPAATSFRAGQTAGTEAAVRLAGYVSLAVFVGGAFLLVAVWPQGATLVRARRLLWMGLAGALGSSLLTLGLKGAGLRGLTAVSAFRPDVIGAVFGTHFANVLLTRAGLLVAAIPLLTLLARKPERAVSSPAWRCSASVIGAGTVATHCLTGHAWAHGWTATLAAFGHLAGATVWLGGLVMLAVVLLPRQEWDEAPAVIRAFSSMAEKAVALMALAGVALFLLLEPSWDGLAASGWGQLILTKLSLVVLILAVARKARSLTRRHVVPAPGAAAVSLQPLAAAVAVELTLAVGVLTATALLVSRNPPG